MKRETRSRRYLPALAALVIMFLSMQISAETLAVRVLDNRRYVSFHELTELLQLHSNFDIGIQKGKIYRGAHYAVFNVGFSVFIIDGRIFRTDYEVMRHKGEVMIPAAAAAEILKKLYVGSAVLLSDTSVEIEAGKKDEISQKIDEKEGKTGDSDSDKIGFIIIDPGHGGKDPGAIGRKNIHEKKITLSVAKMVASNLRNRFKGVRVILTRSKDIFIPLNKRTEIANSNLKIKVNGLFISIHVNASLSDKISGFETYYLSVNPTNEEARNTAALENNVVILEEKDAGTKGYGDVDYIEAMMLTTQIQKESSMLAESVQKGMDLRITKMKSRGLKKADFFVLRGVLMPAALVEIGYITNRKESALLVKQSYQKDVAEGISGGISAFIDRYNRMIGNK